MYRDYAISSELFHWESQNTTSTDSPAGRRYLHHRELGTHLVLFVRDTPRDELGAVPFLCLGQASYVEHRGERPIAITWRLHRPMPPTRSAPRPSSPTEDASGLPSRPYGFPGRGNGGPHPSYGFVQDCW